MRRLRTGSAVLMAVVALTQAAEAQRYYPGGYGRYGWGGWGMGNAAGGYMSGLGSYYRGQGSYEVQDAQARSINVDTMVKWNKALRARQKALREDQAERSSEADAVRRVQAAEADLKSGQALNDLLMQIYLADPAAARSAKAGAPLSPDAIREIPFEWDSEAITICLNQMTAEDALPAALNGPELAPRRAALRQAVEAALREDVAGHIEPATLKRLDEAIAAFHEAFLKDVPEFDPTYNDCKRYFTTMASLERLLGDPAMEQMLASLEGGKERTVGDLIAFMNAFNLRFGRATTDRQQAVYLALGPKLRDVLASVGASAPAVALTPDRDGAALQQAAADVFNAMNWKDLQQHAKDR